MCVPEHCTAAPTGKDVSSSLDRIPAGMLKLSAREQSQTRVLDSKVLVYNPELLPLPPSRIRDRRPEYKT